MADFFSKSVREMTLLEVESLYTERVPENIRLEYKEKLPDDTKAFKDEIAKAISAFANSYGGYLIYGISTDANGNPTAMNGVPEINNLAQRVASIGYEQIFPPVIPVVSNPIALGNGKCIYVIYQDLSLEAPHFLTKRRGAYVRTSEFSQTFTAKLASWEELQFLHNRRHMATQQREKLRERSKERCVLFLQSLRTSFGDPPMFHVAIAPAFPVRRLIELNRIQAVIEDAAFLISRKYSTANYPDGERTFLQDSCAFVKHGSYLEGTAWGTSYSAEVMQPDGRFATIRFEYLLWILLRQIKFGSKLLKACGFDGLINVKASFLNCYMKNFRCGSSDEIDVSCSEPGEIEYQLDKPLHILMRDYRPSCLEIFRVLAFATGWHGVFAQKDEILINHLPEKEEKFFADLP
jgi:hypothetical protein